MKQITDGTVAALAIASPWWVDALQTGLAIMVPLSGFVLVLIRIGLAVREWLQNR